LPRAIPVDVIVTPAFIGHHGVDGTETWPKLFPHNTSGFQGNVFLNTPSESVVIIAISPGLIPSLGVASES
jgi:hypothetical protein